MRRRIIISLSILLALCLLGDAIALLWLYRSVGQLNALVRSHRVQSMRVELTADSVRLETDLLAYLSGHEHTEEERAHHRQRFKRSLQWCSGCHHPPVLKSELDGLGETFDAYLASADRVFAPSDGAKEEGIEQEVLEAVNELVRRSTEMADRAGGHLMTRSTDVASSIRQAWAALLGTLVVVLVFGGFVAFHLMRRLTQPVAGLLEGIERVRQGDLTYRFSEDADEEFRTLAETFNKTYADLRRAHEGMLQTEKLAAVGTLAAGVAHEVLNPLASISSVAQMMRRQCTSDQQVEQLNLIMEEVARLSRIVRQMLSFSRPAGSETTGSVEIPSLLERAATLVSYDPRARRIGITRCFESDIRAVLGDAEKLLLVFTNVMINALDAMSANGDGRGTLAIAARQSGDRVVVEFADDGPGMTEADVSHAFEPFYTTKDHGAGTGLGLWICHQVVQKHAGSIRIDSPPGGGTTVTVALPCECEAVG